MALSLDPMYSTAVLPALLSPNHGTRALPAILAHDIDGENWLSEIGMSQYIEVFMANFGDGSSRLLNRKRLGLVRLDNLPKMGITQFHHLKIIMEHIRHTLLFEFNSPIRKREVQAKMQSSSAANAAAKVNVGKLPEIPEFRGGGGEDKNKKFAEHTKKAAPTRRRSFDKNVWNSISKLRTSDQASLEAVEALRSGNYEAAEKMENQSQERRRRRKSFGEDPSLGSSRHHAAKEYGNKVHHMGLMQKELQELQSNHLAKLKKLVRCEHASIYFLNDRTKDLLLVTEAGIWFRLAPSSGIAGYCVDHGEAICLADAYSDPRFNSNLDEKTGWKTKSILCQPLRGQRGGGIVIGAVQCINKQDGAEFDSSDEEHLAVCCQRIADELHIQFQDLLHIAEHVSGIAIFVGEKGGHGYLRSEEHKVTQPTSASVAGTRRKDAHVSEPVWHG